MTPLTGKLREAWLFPTPVESALFDVVDATQSTEGCIFCGAKSDEHGVGCPIPALRAALDAEGLL